MTRPEERHVPVLLTEALQYLAIRPGSVVVDCTVGMGGHSEAILRQLGPRGKLIGFDRDPQALSMARERLDRVRRELGTEAPAMELIGDAFSAAAAHLGSADADGMLADFGVSSLQLDEAARGFSFSVEGPLDMRMDPRQEPSAAQVVNEASERELADLIYQFSDERRSRRIARAIVKGRPVTTTTQLARIVAAAVPSMKGDRIHPATRTFQGLRIYVNRELDEIQALLEAAPILLKPSGRFVAISFHSLEDRLVKDSLRDGAHAGIWTVLTKKPVTASEDEIEQNPRSRSAKLRAAERQRAGSREQRVGSGE